MKKYFFLLSTILLTSSLVAEEKTIDFSQEEKRTETTNVSTTPEVIKEVPPADSNKIDQQMPAMSNEIAPNEKANPMATKKELNEELNVPSSGAYNIEGAWDFYTWVSFLYWQPKQEGLEVGKVFTTSGEPSYILKQDFDFKPGFKIGIGAHFDYDDWVASLEYTYLGARDRKGFDIEEDASFQSSWIASANSDIEHVRSMWRMHLNLLDGMKARPFYVGKKLILQPSYGVRTFWLNQKLNEECTRASNNLEYHFHGLVHSWAIGLKGGLNTQWMLDQGYRFFAHVATSLFYQRFHARVSFDDITAATPGVIALFAKQQKGNINPSIEAATGFGWGRYLMGQKLHIDLYAAYEFQYFWHQNELINMVQDFRDNVRAASEGLSMQGLTVTLRVDY